MAWTSGRRGVLAVAAFALAATALWGAYRQGWVGPEKVAGPVRITAQPAAIWIEAGDTSQSLNFDFLIENNGDTPLGIDSIELTVRDAAGKPSVRRFIDGNGFAPAIETVAGRMVPAHGKSIVFNPFHSFHNGVELASLEYKFGLSIPQEVPETRASVVVHPKTFVAKTALGLPVKGRVLIHDGHDFYAHHRRLDTEHVAAKQFGLSRNFMRYSLDINPAGQDFELFRNSGAKNEDWYAWEQPLYATGDGIVVATSDAAPDNIRGGKNYFDPQAVVKTPMKFYGNYVVIDHRNGEFSLLGHVRQGSVSVKVGDAVTRGQSVAKIGSSGSSNNPHVHYELRTGKDLQVEGLPAIFRGFTRVLGTKSVSVEAGPVDSGDLLEVK
ncbi:MAG: M23 family metallopeptidase [Ramlibacter sp.]|nr:M23 family metallopeptidase [Ramlibacter sp.]